MSWQIWHDTMVGNYEPVMFHVKHLSGIIKANTVSMTMTSDLWLFRNQRMVTKDINVVVGYN